MSFWKHVREGSLAQLSWAFGGIGGVVGMLGLFVQSGWMSMWLAVPIGLYSAALVAHSKASRERDAAFAEAKALRDQIARRAGFDVSVTSERSIAVWSREGATEPASTFWIVLSDATITNRSDVTLPLDFWLFIGADETSMRYGNRANAGEAPAWVTGQLVAALRGVPVMPNPLNIPPSHSVRGYLAFEFTNGGFVRVSNVEEAREVVDVGGMWLTVKNRLTEQEKSFPLNLVARRAEVASRRHSVPSR